MRAARELGWTRLLVQIDQVSGVEAKLRLAELHSGRGLSELASAPMALCISGAVGAVA